ncbi:MAG: DUF3822 family protein [Bacteroidota bacterium]
MSTQALPVTKNFIDREQLSQIVATCDLWVLFAADKITLLAADKSNQRVAGLTVLESPDVHVFQKGLFDLRSWIEGLELYGLDYNNTHIVFETPEFCIVPEALFATEKAETILGLQHELPKFSAVLTNRILQKQWVNVFAVPQLFVSTVKVLFPQADLHHYATFMLQAFAATNHKQKDTLYVNVHTQYIDVVHMHEQELLFANTFQTEADTDIIYFILSVAEQQKINVDKLKLVLTGDVNATSALLSLLKKYVPEVLLLKRYTEFTYPASFREFEDQQYFTSTAVLLCE